MEKRKRQRETLDQEEDLSCDEKKAMNVKREDDREETVAKASPSEEEVEEFFAILRRMHEAVKYFDQKGLGHGVEDGRWKAAFEAEVAARVDEEEPEVDNDIDDNKVMTTVSIERENKGAVEIDGVHGDYPILDLNCLPKDGQGGN